MNAKRSLMAALVGIATMIAMPLVATAGDHYTNRYENTQWQARGAVMPAVDHHGWRNSAGHNSQLICDEDVDDWRSAVQCDEDGDDCYSTASPDEYDNYSEPYAGYRGQYRSQSRNYRARNYRGYSASPAYNSPAQNGLLGGFAGVPAYNNYGYDRGNGGAYNAPYGNNGTYNNGANGGLSTLMPLLQQFVR